jgi:GNAT superfamily N-acetyltransferase
MIRVRSLTAADLPLGLRLSRAAGWNQTYVDWQRCLDLQPDGCFVAEYDGVAVGTTTTLIFGSVAWIAMVLVEESLRGRGIGRALLTAALDFLDRRQVPTIRLDATPLGQPLYERLGFVEQFRLARCEGTASPSAGAEVEPVTPEQWEELAALDEAVTATDRRRLLFRLFAESPESVRQVRRDGRAVGFLTFRIGAQAAQMGPCIASADAGPLLLADAWRRCAGQRVYLDIPLSNEPALRQATDRGLTVQRHLLRMVRGVARCEDVARLWTAFGPEKG